MRAPGKPQKKFLEHLEVSNKEKLHEKFGRHKKFARGYELPALIALAFYPELHDIDIKFVFVKSNTPFSSRPEPSTVLLSPEKRKYRINITKEIKKGRESVLPRNLDFNMLVGLIGHEFAHISDYLKKNSIQTIGTGVFYPLPAYKKKLEKNIDQSTVAHGLGHQLMEFANFIKELQKKFPEDKYFSSYFDYYYSPAEIEKEMAHSPIYHHKD